MKLKNIKRNSLDYILTDILPVEISELFTYRYYYDFLLHNNNNNVLKREIKLVIEKKNSADKKIKLFEDNKLWASIPLKYNISKGEASIRELNVLQPIAAMQIYYFITAFQEELLKHLETNAIFSLRYHKKASTLYYKQRKKNITQYFSNISEELSKRVLEQTGRYFDLSPYTSIVNFTSSDEWYDLNLKYKYFVRIDYKSCFDSIYTHTYKWLISRDINDSTGFKNTNIFTTIDRLLQNINASQSNGIVVGPEFSRIIAELLLQQIDMKVHAELLTCNYELNLNYSIKRYVDDVFIFSETEELGDQIVSLYEKFSQNFLLKLNDQKKVKKRLPFVLTNWLNGASTYATNASTSIFYGQDELKKQKSDGDSIHVFKSRMFLMLKSVLKRNFNDLVAEYPDEKSRLVSYVLGMLLNKISTVRTTKQYSLFRKNVTDSTVFEFLDYIFYIFSHATTFDNTQKIISIISYINDDVLLTQNRHVVIQKILEKYSYIFIRSNPNDIINLVLFCAECKIEITYEYEIALKSILYKSDNPISVATFLVYAQYNAKFFDQVKAEVNSIISERMKAIRNRMRILTYREFWWLLVFNHCPHITQTNQTVFNDLIDTLRSRSQNTDLGCQTMLTYHQFLKTNDSQFFCWDIEERNFIKEITYRTHERTIFRNYKYSQSVYSSIE